MDRTSIPDLITVPSVLAALALAVGAAAIVAGRRSIRPRVIPLLFIVSGWLLSGALFVMGVRDQLDRDHADLNRLTAYAQASIQQRMTTYVDALRSGASFLVASRAVTRESWAVFAATLDLSTRYPGANGIGVIYPMAAKDSLTFVRRAREDGVPSFAIHSTVRGIPSADGVRYVVTFVAPEAGNGPALGLDLASERARRLAADEARDSGMAHMTDRIELVQDQRQRPGFLLYVPVYRTGAPRATVAERRAALQAWVYAPFVTEDFLHGVLAANTERLHVHLFEKDSIATPNLLFASDSATAAEAAYALVTTIDLAGQRFHLGWNRGDSYVPPPPSPLIWLALLLGLTVTGLVVWMTREQRFAQRAHALVLERTRELSESEYRWKFAIEGAGDGLWDWDMVTNTVFFSPRWKAMLGYAEDEIGNNVSEWESRLHPDDKPRAMLAVQAHAQGATPRYECEHRVRRKDGSWLWIQDQGLVVSRDSANVPLRMIGKHRDISERKDSEAKLLVSEVRYRRLMFASTDGFWLADLTGKLLEVNDAYVRMSGYSEAELLTMRVSQLEINETPEQTAAHVLAVQQHGHDRFESRHRTKDGREIEVEISLQFHDVDGGRLVCFCRDLTELNAAKAATARLAEELDQALRLESVGRLAGGVAHDFNNMLGVILGNTELALDQLDPSDPVHQDLTEIRIAAERSAQLTRQLLTFARKQSIAPTVLQLNDVVPGTLSTLRRVIREEVSLEWRPGKELWLIAMDPSQVEQMVTNLCVNARDAIAKVGSVTISTANVVVGEAWRTAHPDAVPGEYVQLTVRDTGSGMDSVTMAQIFEPFFTTKAIGEGTGLGLASVYGAVHQNRGFITVSSVVGYGTTFAIYIPRMRDPQSSAARTPLADRQGATARQKRETVLIVEDEPALLGLVTRALTSHGYTVLGAGTPHEALRLAQAHRAEIRLVLCDVVMPLMNGRELSQLIRAICPQSALLFMSGYPSDVIAHHGMLDENVHLIQKPFTLTDLAASVRAAIDGAHDGALESAVVVPPAVP